MIIEDKSNFIENFATRIERVIAFLTLRNLSTSITVNLTSNVILSDTEICWMMYGFTSFEIITPEFEEKKVTGKISIEKCIGDITIYIYTDETLPLNTISCDQYLDNFVVISEINLGNSYPIIGETETTTTTQAPITTSTTTTTTTQAPTTTTTTTSTTTTTTTTLAPGQINMSIVPVYELNNPGDGLNS